MNLLKKTKISILISIFVSIGFIIFLYYLLNISDLIKLFPFENDSTRYIKSKTEKIKEEPNNHWNYYLRGDEYIKIKKYKEAVEDFDKAIKINNNFKFAYQKKAIALLGDGKKKEALTAIDKAIIIQPESRNKYFIKALIYDSLCELTNTLKNYSLYIENKPYDDFPKTYSYALKRRALNYFLLGKASEAKQDIKEALKYNSDDEDLRDLMEFFNDNKSKELSEKLKKLNVDEAISIEW